MEREESGSCRQSSVDYNQMHMPSLSLQTTTAQISSYLISRNLWVHLPNLPNGSCEFSTRRKLGPCPVILRHGGGRNGIRCEVLERGRNVGEDDGFFIRRCVELARKAVGCTSPNPMVGCVIVKDGVVVGEGFHPKAGQPHAEVFAIIDAGKLTENSTAYVSLEPCNHYGRTPPCTEALIQAKVKRVVVGMVDPNPIVASKGVERLRGSGINVTVGVEEELCRKLNETYIHKMLTGKPFVTLRYTLPEQDKLCEEARKVASEPGGYYSKLLQENDGVAISSKTLIKRTRFPFSQEVGANQPVLIIIASDKASPLQIPAFSMEAGTRAIVFVEEKTVMEPVTESNIKQQGIEVVVLDQIKLNPILEYSSRLGMCSLLLDISDDDEIREELLEDAEDDVQKVVMDVSLGETEDYSVIKLGRKTFTVRDKQSRTVKESTVLEGYLS